MATAMSHTQFLAVLREQGAVAMQGHISSLVPAAMNLGWDLTRWRVQTIPGAALFYRVTSLDDPIIESPRIMAINADEEDRAKWEAELADELAADPGETILVFARFRR